MNDRRLTHIGCCGFRRSRSDYYQRFMAVEVQHTFYDPPSLKTLQKWREEAPDSFIFTLKAWQLITHQGQSPTYKRLKRDISEAALAQCGFFAPTDVVHEAMDTTLQCASSLRSPVIVFQCPARFTPSDPHIENLQRFFTRYRSTSELRFGWEPRGKWPPALVQSLCQELSLLHVTDPFTAEPVTQAPYYFRIHGKRGKAFEFRDEEMLELAESVPQDDEAYVFFNNWRMLEDASRLLDALAKRGS